MMIGSEEEKYLQKAVQSLVPKGEQLIQTGHMMNPQNKQTILLLSRTTLQKPGYMILNRI